MVASSIYTCIVISFLLYRSINVGIRYWLLFKSCGTQSHLIMLDAINASIWYMYILNGNLMIVDVVINIFVGHGIDHELNIGRWYF